MLGIILTNTLNASAWSITDQPGDQAWVHTDTSPHLVTYKTDAEGGFGVTFERTAIASANAKCEPGASSGVGPLITTHNWFGGNLDVDLKSQLNGLVSNLGMEPDYYDDPDLAFDREDGNGYFCMLFRIRFSYDVDRIWSNEIRVKVYAKEVPSGFFGSLPIPIYVPLITLGILVLLTKSKSRVTY